MLRKCLHKIDRLANSEDPDQTAPLGAVWSGSALFAQTYLSENLGSLLYCILEKSRPPLSLLPPPPHTMHTPTTNI